MELFGQIPDVDLESLKFTFVLKNSTLPLDESTLAKVLNEAFKSLRPSLNDLLSKYRIRLPSFQGVSAADVVIDYQDDFLTVSADLTTSSSDKPTFRRWVKRITNEVIRVEQRTVDRVRRFGSRLRSFLGLNPERGN